MSKVEHPAHYGGDTPYEVIKVLRMWLSPTEFLGFLKGNVIKYTARANMKGGIEDHQKALWYDRHIVTFIQEQRADGEPDGLATEPLFWTDLDTAETSDLDEVLALAPVCHPFLLCSSVSPHARWAVKLHSEDNEPVYFPSREAAQREADAAMEEGRRERERLIEEAFAACAIGDIEKVAALLDDANFDVSINHGARTLTIEGRTEPFGPPPPQEAPPQTHPERMGYGT